MALCEYNKRRERIEAIKVEKVKEFIKKLKKYMHLSSYNNKVIDDVFGEELANG